MPRPAAALASPDEHDVFQDEPPVLPPEFQISSHHLYRKRTAAAARRALLPIPVTPMSGNGKAPRGPNFLLPARAGDAILFQRLLNAASRNLAPRELRLSAARRKFTFAGYPQQY